MRHLFVISLRRLNGTPAVVYTPGAERTIRVVEDRTLTITEDRTISVRRN